MGPHPGRVHVGREPWIPDPERRGGPDTTPPSPPSQEPAQARAGTPEPSRQPVVLAVDGTGLMVRCSHAGKLRGLSTSSGIPTASLLMFISSLARKIRITRPSYVVIAWDGPHARIWRQELYPGYKAHRPEANSGREQGRAIEFCSAAGMCQRMVPGFEADDILAAVQRAFYRELPDHCLVIASDDFDMLQLAADGTVITGLRDDTLITHEDVWGVKPWHLARVRALAGDSSDNIPGLPGVGVVKAVRMLREGGYAWPLPEHVLADAADRAQVAVWREIIDLIDPPRRPEEAVGMDHFSLKTHARWEPPGSDGKVRDLLVKYELSGLTARLDKGRLW